MTNDISANVAATANSTSKAELGAEIITGTLDAINSPMYSGGKNEGNQGAMSDSYHFQKKVLSAAYSAKGAIADAEG